LEYFSVVFKKTAIYTLKEYPVGIKIYFIQMRTAFLLHMLGIRLFDNFNVSKSEFKLVDYVKKYLSIWLYYYV